MNFMNTQMINSPENERRRASARLLSKCVFPVMVVFALLSAPAGLRAQEDEPPPSESQVTISGNYTSGYTLKADNGTMYNITAGSLITYNTITSGYSALNDGDGSSENWMIRNSGTIGAYPNGLSPYIGIYLTTTGSSMIVNEASGFIRSNRNSNDYAAIVGFNGHLSLINAGEIRGHVGVRTYRGGFVSNSGLIYGSSFAVLLYAYDANQANYPGLVINTGTIQINASNAAIRVDYYDSIVRNIGGVIQVTDSAGDASIGVQMARGGLIENSDNGLIFAKGNVIHMTTGGTLVHQSGTIKSTTRSAVNILGSNRSNVYVGSTALIQGAGGDSTAYGGIHAASAALDVENHGIITGDAKGVYIGTGAGSIINNYAGALISNTYALVAAATGAAASAGISTNTATSITINNAGAIEGRPYGIYLGGGGDIYNTGTIKASGAAIASIYFSSTNRSGSLRLGTGSVLIGDVISNSVSQNRLILEGSGSADYGFIGTDATTGFATLAMNGGAWTLGGAVSLTNNSGTALSVTTGTLSIGNTVNFRNASGGATVASGAVLRLIDGANFSMPTAGASAKIALSGRMLFDRSDTSTFNGTISGTGSVTKTGAGTVTLTGTNTYGDTFIEQGVLSGMLGKGMLTIAATGTYRAASGLDLTASGLTGDGTIELGTSNLIFDVASGTSAFDFAGTITGGNQFVKTGSGTIELMRAIPVANGLSIKNGVVVLDDQAKIGPGALTLGDASTRGMLQYTGAANWTKNIGLIGAGGGFIVNNNISFVATATGAGDFVKSGSGTLDITGAAMNNTGNTVVSGGVLKGNVGTIKGNTRVDAGATIEFNQSVAGAYAGTISGSGALRKSGAGTLNLTGTNTYGDTIIDIGLLEGNIGVGTLTVNSSGTYKMGASSAVTVAGILGNGTVDLNSNNLAFDVAAGQTGTFGFAGSLINGNAFEKTGAGTLELASAIGLATANIKNGAVKLGDQSKLNAATITLGDTSSIGLLEYTGAANWTKSIALTGSGGGFAISNSAALVATVTGARDFVKSGSGTLDITGAAMNNTGNTVVSGGVLKGNVGTIKGNTRVDAGATIEFNQSVAGAYAGTISGSGALRKSGAGTLNLTGTNTYGDTIIDTGLLEGNIGIGTLTVNSSGTYKMGASSGVTVAGILGNGTVDLNSNNLTFDVAAGQTGTFGFAGSLINGNAFEKIGAGTLELASAIGLAAANIKNGALKLDDQSKLNATTITLGDAASIGLLEYTGAANWTKNIALTGSGGGFAISNSAALVATVTGAGDFVKSGSGTLDVTGATMNNTGNTVVSGGVLKGNVATIKGNTRVDAGAVVEFNQIATGTYAGVISGSGALHKTGAGTLTLDGANTYSDTVVKEGVLIGTIGEGMLDIQAQGNYRVRDGQQDYVTKGVIGSGTFDLNQANLAFDIASGTSVWSFSGTYVGAGGNKFVKQGAGTLDLQTRATLPGGSFIKEGIVRLADQDFLSEAIVLGDAATVGLLEYTGTTAWTKTLQLTGSGGGFYIGAGRSAAVSATITGDAPFIKDGAGRLNASGATFSGVTAAKILSGTLVVSGQTLPQSAAISSGATLEFLETTSSTYSGSVAGAGAVLKTGQGELVMTTPFAHTGTTAVREGVIRAGAANIWPAAARVTVERAGAIDMGGFPQTIGTLVNNGAIIFNASVNSVAAVIYNADSLTVTTAASGTGKIRVKLNEVALDGVSWSTQATLLDFTGAGNPTYTPELDGRHVAGAYEWMVTKSGSKYMLSADQLSPEVPAAGGLDDAGYLNGKASLTSLSQRLMMQRSDTGAHSFQLWTNGLFRQDQLKNKLYDRAEAKTYGIQAGGDWNNKSSNADRFFTFGLFYDYAETEMDLDAKTSSTKTKSNAVGLYASYRPGVIYADMIVRSAEEDYEIHVPGTPMFKTKGTSIAASIEVGGRMPVAWSWNIEPQLQAIVQKHTIDDTVDYLDRSYTFESGDTLMGRFGVRLWREIQLGSPGKKLKPYIRANLVYEWDGFSSVTIDGMEFENRVFGSFGQIDAGAALELGRHFVISADAGWYAGAKMNGYSADVSLGLRW